MYSAIAVYMLAFFAYCAEWAFGSRGRVAVHSARTTAPAPERELVGAGVGARPGAPARPGPAERLTGRGRDGARPTGPRDGDLVADQGDVAGGDPQADRYGRIAVSLTLLGFVLHAAAVLSRGLSVRRAPWGNMYEFSTAVALMLVVAYLVMLFRFRQRWLGLFVMVPLIATLGVAVTVLYTESDQLVPALDSYWIWIHVASATASFAAFHIGAIASVLYLFKDARERRAAAGAPLGRGGRLLDRLPSAATLDRTAYRVNAVIFPLWTFAIVVGAVWAESAWGRYWGWDPKETWSFITWVAYAAYLHARATAGWKGRRAAVISLVGFACFVFNYYLVNIFFEGLHSYGGV
ncbi:c-type cytochrome biogenesis protein CcsB [Allostreptomyces psammosilenae]|nr:c-type cytochrome biogenesis protein CcsB [Allostreptomyces psammosilenae]